MEWTREASLLFFLCGSLTEDFLPLKMIYKGKTTRCHPKFEFTLRWHITHAPKHWSAYPKALIWHWSACPKALVCMPQSIGLHAPKHWSACPKALVCMPQSIGLALVCMPQSIGLHAPKHWSTEQTCYST